MPPSPHQQPHRISGSAGSSRRPDLGPDGTWADALRGTRGTGTPRSAKPAPPAASPRDEFLASRLAAILTPRSGQVSRQPTGMQTPRTPNTPRDSRTAHRPSPRPGTYTTVHGSPKNQRGVPRIFLAHIKDSEETEEEERGQTKLGTARAELATPRAANTPRDLPPRPPYSDMLSVEAPRPPQTPRRGVATPRGLTTLRSGPGTRTARESECHCPAAVPRLHALPAPDRLQHLRPLILLSCAAFPWDVPPGASPRRAWEANRSLQNPDSVQTLLGQHRPSSLPGGPPTQTCTSQVYGWGDETGAGVDHSAVRRMKQVSAPVEDCSASTAGGCMPTCRLRWSCVAPLNSG